MITEFDLASLLSGDYASAVVEPARVDDDAPIPYALPDEPEPTPVVVAARLPALSAERRGSGYTVLSAGLVIVRPTRDAASWYALRADGARFVGARTLRACLDRAARRLRDISEGRDAGAIHYGA